MPLPDNTSGSFRVNAQRNRKVPCSVLYHQQWGGTQPWSQPVPAAAVAAGGSVAVAGPLTTTKSIPLTGTLCAGGVMLFDVPRNVVIVVTAAAVVALTGIITGLDLDGQIIQETISGITTGGVSKTFTGAKAFKTVTDVTVTSVADATTDLIQIGSGILLGLDVAASHISPVKELTDGAVPGAGALVVGVFPQTLSADQRGTFAPVAAPNGAHTYDVWYITDTPWLS
jgi:hypothetical protein